MHTPQWFFRKFAPGDNLSDPDFAKALFASDSDTAVARSLVRESLQNSLDAKASGANRVRVRIALNRGALAAPTQSAAPFLAGLAPHVGATDNGLPDRPSLHDPIPFLVLEDFGTRGLQGSPDHWQPTGIAANAFFLFFRALGRSGKADESRGRWGVGKFVFPMSSRAHAFLALTIPDDTKVPLLMGRTVLRTHQTNNDQWHPDGHWGLRTEQGSQLVTPVSDATLVSRFREVFNLSRSTESGLSVVVPWLIDEIDPNAIRDAVLGEYFLPLLRGELIVELVDNGVTQVIDGHAVREFADKADDRGLKERLSLAVSVVDGKGISLDWPAKLSYNDPTLRREDIPDTLRDLLNGNLDEGHTVSMNVPVTVRRKDSKTEVEGKLTVHLRRAEGLGGMRPLIIRDGISLPEDRTRVVYDHASLLVAERCALASAIGDAETPAHEQMQHELLKDRYVYPKKLVTFVRDSASALLKAIRHGDGEDDPFTLASYFPIETQAGPKLPADAPKPKDKKVITKLPDLPPSPPRRFRVTRVAGGFTISGNKDATNPVEELRVSVAYDVRRGNPFAKYRPYDFDLSDRALKKTEEDCVITSVSENNLTVRPSAPGFSLTVNGFDIERDLIVKVLVAGGES